MSAMTVPPLADVPEGVQLALCTMCGCVRTRSDRFAPDTAKLLACVGCDRATYHVGVRLEPLGDWKEQRNRQGVS